MNASRQGLPRWFPLAVAGVALATVAVLAWWIFAPTIRLPQPEARMASGRVIDEHGAPVPGAFVIARPVNGAKWDNAHSRGAWTAPASPEPSDEVRLLRDEQSIADVSESGVLVVSQFTLYGDGRKGRRPTWAAAAGRDVAEPLIDTFVSALRARGARVATGVFGGDMRLSLVNDGPVTLLLEV